MLFPRSPLNHFPQGWGRDCGEQASEGPQAQRRARKASVYLRRTEGVGGQSASKKSSREPGCAHRRSTEQIPGGGGPGFSSPGRFSPEGPRKMGPTGMSVWTLEAQTPVSGAKCIVGLGAEARGRSE